MSVRKRKELEDRRDAEAAAARAILAVSEAEERDFTPEEREKLAGHLAEAKAAQDGMQALDADAQLREQVRAISDVGGPVEPGAKGGAPPASLGARYVGSKEYRGMLDRFGGQIPDRAAVAAAPFRFERNRGRTARAKAVVGSGGLAGLVPPDYLGLADQGALFRPLRINDLITQGETTSDLIDFVVERAYTNAAAVVAEADDTAASGTKPESGLTLAQQQAPVVTIAHWIPVTRRALSDAGQIRTLIDNFLNYGLDEAEEDQYINGDGAAGNLNGVLHTVGVQNDAFDTDILTTARKARTRITLSGQQGGGGTTPTAYVLNPLDWEAIELTTDSTGRYYYGGPATLATPTLWGLPVVESETLAQGTGIVADWTKAVAWSREQNTITISDSHQDFFVRNLVAILAEERLAFALIRPAAFCTFPTTSGGGTREANGGNGGSHHRNAGK